MGVPTVTLIRQPLKPSYIECRWEAPEVPGRFDQFAGVTVDTGASDVEEMKSQLVDKDWIPD